MPRKVKTSEHEEEQEHHESSHKHDNIYCVTCRKHTPTKDAHNVITKNHRKMVKGKCEVCTRGKACFV